MASTKKHSHEARSRKTSHSRPHAHEDRRSGSLTNLSIAILCTDGVEQSELIEPKASLEEAGARVTIVSPKEATVRASIRQQPADTFDVDLNVTEADAEDFDALILPGGALNGDQLRTDHDAIRFVRGFHQECKPIAAICHGVWLLAEAKLVDGFRLTSTPSIKTDLVNAGADWIDESVVIDDRGGGLVTSRCVDDLYDFNRALLDYFAQAAANAAGDRAENTDELRTQSGGFTPGAFLD